MKKIWITAGVLVLIVVLVSVSVYRQVAAKGPAVKIVQPKQEEISSVLMIPGTVRLVDQQIVYPSADQGKLKDVAVKEGQKVKKDDLLVTFENQQLKLESEQNKIAKESAYLKLNQLVRQEEQLKKKEKDLKKTVSQKEAAEQLEPEYDQLRTDKQMANLELKRVLLEEDTIKERMNDLEVKSSVEGIVLKVNKEASVASETGLAEPIIQVGRLDGMQAVGTLSEYDTLKVKKGQKVTLRSDAVPDQKWQGKVAEIGTLPEESTAVSQTGDAQAVQYSIRVKITSEMGVLKPGFQLFMEIETEKKQALVLPIEALVDEGEKSFVYVVEKNKLKKQKVDLGITSGEQLEIVKGLTKKDKVVLNPTEELQTGMEVTIE